LPVALQLFAGNRGDVKALGSLLHALPEASQLTADRAYDVPWFRIRLMYLGFKPNIPYRATWLEHLKTRKPGRPPENPLTFKERWKIERCFAWFSHFRRLNIRWERHANLYEAFWYLAAARILLPHVLG
jgi:transposase